MKPPVPEYSAAYYTALEEAKAHHASNKTYSGKFLRTHAVPIQAIILEHGIRDILDWGCGKGQQYRWRSHDDSTGVPQGQSIEEFWGREVRKYDPAYPPYAKPPVMRYDLVICTHVLGSIPVQDLSPFLKELMGHARKVVYIAEKIGPVRKQVFSDAQGMPRWSRDQWVAALRLAALDFPALKLRFATRERTADRGIVNTSEWL